MSCLGKDCIFIKSLLKGQEPWAPTVNELVENRKKKKRDTIHAIFA